MTSSDYDDGIPEASSERMGGPRGWSRKYVGRLVLTDIIAITATFSFAHAVRFAGEFFAPVAGPAAPSHAAVSLAVGALWVLQLGWNRSREPRILGHGPQEFQRVVQASWRTFAIVAVIGFATQWQISRGYLLLAFPIGTVALLAGRSVWRLWIHRQRDRGELQAQVVVVGPVKLTEQLIERLRGSRRAGFHVLGVCLPGAADGELYSEVAGVPVLGKVDDAANIAVDIGAEYLIVSGTDAMSMREARQLGWALEGTGVGLIVAPAMVDVAGPRVQMSPVEGLPLLHVDPPTFAGGKYVLKEIADRTAAAFLLLLASIPMAILAVVIKVTSPGPVFFRQVRVGRDEHPFAMYKFRSMYVDAEARLAEVRETHSVDAGNEILFKMKDDPRVTPVGRFMRRFSIDELPQLLNVVKGDMSMVGPRPPLPEEAEAWEHSVARRQLVKPGITGLWQVSGRSDLSWEESVRLDLYYAENWSLGGDALIVLRTVWAVVAGRGAY